MHMQKQDFSNKDAMVIGGVKLHYEYLRGNQAKEGPVILLIHGFISCSYCFRYIMPKLSEEYPVIAVDLPGFGKSEKSKTFTYSFESYAALLFTFLDKLQVKETIVVGHSMGGQVALYMAKQKPEQVKKIVLMSSSGYLKRVKKHYLFASYLPFSPKVLKWYFEKRNYKEALSHVVYDKTAVNDNSVKEYTRAFKDEGFYEALIRLARHREGDLTSEQLHLITQPALLLWGKEDEIIPFRIGKRLDHDLPNATLYGYEKTGHLLPEERPDEVVERMLQFI
ncbi:alpha/beta fold hydrolase [Bacillus alkalicellulosilyticus]|uniref:alpha/beta fold hydrolase n=1 Tax=Alkalihalobacterium alkalicellulosilyticum TaxID=1912214 RepID=UPI001117500B|nr:alpha/beta hydrolase [Bacillus alkalicellulosilyticus]